MPLRVPFLAALALQKSAVVRGLEEGQGPHEEQGGGWTQEEPWQASPSLLLSLLTASL